MDRLKYFLIFLLVSSVAGAAYLDEISVLIGGSAPSSTNPLPVQLSNGAAFISALPVTDNGGSLTVDGTVAATQSGAWTVQQGTPPWSVSQSGTWNINNITGTVSLPTGASTSALQTTGNTSLGNIDADLDVALSTRASAANQTNGTQKTRITSDGTNDALVTNLAPASSAYGLTVRPISLELATYSAVATNVVVGNNKSMLSIQNTGTSVVRIREVWIINDRTVAVTGIAGLFEVRRITSFTGGTAITPVSYDTADTLPAGITVATNATVAGEGVLLRSGVWSTDEWRPGTLDTESLDHALQQQTPFWSQTMNGKALTIRQNQGIHVKFATNSTAGEFNIRFVFTVE